MKLLNFNVLFYLICVLCDINDNKLNEIIYDLIVNCLLSIYLLKYNNFVLECFFILVKGFFE